jgi:hypothetical protein
VPIFDCYRKGDRMKSARDRWFEQLHAERERRLATTLMVDGQDPREAFMARLAVIGERLCTVPDYVDPSEAQKKQWRREIDAFFSPLRTDSLPFVSKIYWPENADDAIMDAP